MSDPDPALARLVPIKCAFRIKWVLYLLGKNMVRFMMDPALALLRPGFAEVQQDEKRASTFFFVRVCQIFLFYLDFRNGDPKMHLHK